MLADTCCLGVHERRFFDDLTRAADVDPIHHRLQCHMDTTAGALQPRSLAFPNPVFQRLHTTAAYYSYAP